MKRPWIWLTLQLILIGVASATTVIPMSIEQLTRAATHVLEGQALDSWSAWDASHRLIYTFTRIQIGRSLKGSPSSYVVVKQMGGSAGGYSQKVAGVRSFMAGEKSVLFLRPSEANDGTMVIVGLMQGNFRVFQTPDGQTMATNGVPDVSTLKESGSIGKYSGTAIPLADMESRIMRAVAQ